MTVNSLFLRISVFLIIIGFCLIICPFDSFAQEPWPWGEPTNITDIEGPEPNDFYVDMSGASWNPLDETLWVCRNGPGGAGSKLWVIQANGYGDFAIDYREGQRGEWTGFGDLEGVTQADFTEDVVYGIVEDAQAIREYDVSEYGTIAVNNSWDISSYIPTSGGSGAEGIVFVPDESLAAGGFVDGEGLPRISANGMNGLMFAAHQNGGKIYVFDLNRSDGTFDFVGEYATSYNESAGLEFDRSAHHLYIWHGGGWNNLEITELSSYLTGPDRKLTEVVVYEGPCDGNLEGFAGTMPDEPYAWFFLTIDGGGAESLLWFHPEAPVVPAAGKFALIILVICTSLLIIMKRQIIN